MLSLSRSIAALPIRSLHVSATVNGSVFMKKQKKMDAEVSPRNSPYLAMFKTSLSLRGKS